MALIPLYEAKTYLRVDSSDEDALIGILLSSAEQMCKDVGRLSEDQWEAVNAADRDAENGVQPTRELEALRSTCRVAILYALGYLYEHRDEADHKQLMLTLRSIPFAVREGGILMIEKLNERITIEKSTVVTDKVGNHRNTWEDYFTCFAYASTYQAQEEEGEVTAEQKSVVFTVRWCSETRGLTSTGYRIRFREQLYNIETVDPMNYQKKILKIHCRLERRQPDEQNRQHR